MKIIIVGAGLAGLCAAYCLSFHGHNVVVLEQRSSLSNQGNGIGIWVRPAASRILHTWGLKPDLEAISEASPMIALRSVRTGDVATRSPFVDGSESEGWHTMRDHLLQLLLRKATAAGAEVRFGCAVVDVKEDGKKASVHLASWEELTADLVLAADGIRSRMRSRVLADIAATSSVEPILSDTTFYGIRVLEPQLATRPQETRRLTDHAYTNAYAGHDRFVIARWNRKLRAFSAVYAVRSPTDQKGLWDEHGDIDYVRDVFSSSCVELRTALALANTCDRWRLAELPDLPRWNSKGGRIVLLGDSAHAMHPNAGQGFSSTVEDIGVLDYLFGQAGHEAAQRVQSITIHWQKIRKPRVERLKAYARSNTDTWTKEPTFAAGRVKAEGRENSTTVETRSLKYTVPDRDGNFHSSRFVKWVLDYDAIGEVSDLRIWCGRWH